MDCLIRVVIISGGMAESGILVLGIQVNHYHHGPKWLRDACGHALSLAYGRQYAMEGDVQRTGLGTWAMAPGARDCGMGCG